MEGLKTQDNSWKRTVHVCFDDSRTPVTESPGTEATTVRHLFGLISTVLECRANTILGDVYKVLKIYDIFSFFLFFIVDIWRKIPSVKKI